LSPLFFVWEYTTGRPQFKLMQVGCSGKFSIFFIIAGLGVLSSIRTTYGNANL